jgi:hypothetical protein
MTLVPSGVAESISQAKGVTSAKENVTSVVERWLDCVECTDGELKKVSEAGNAAVPALRIVLLTGLAPERRKNMQQALRAQYRLLATQVKLGTRITELEFIEQNLTRSERIQRIRAAVALGIIRTEESLIALRAAKDVDLELAVRDVVTRALNENR